MCRFWNGGVTMGNSKRLLKGKGTGKCESLGEEGLDK